MVDNKKNKQTKR